ncbi:nucleoporin complex subunit 54-domain-containing protein [Phlebopus sp. FC_14]|nr:nucleoporin complex subunit 54-domain-containing protein [Phlebopus sp. FC_14]
MSAFGASGTQNQSGSSLFGGTNTQQGQSTTAGTSLFGNTTQSTNQPPTTGSSIFGNPAPTVGTSAFGATPSATGGSIFGNTGTNTGGGSLLGTQQQPGTGSIFGSTAGQQQPTTGSLFGGTTTQQQAATSSSLFGNTTTQPQQPSSGSIFGNTAATQQPATGSLFGSTSTQQQQPTANPLVGGTTVQQPSGSIFGSTATAQQPSSGGPFGTTAQQPTTSLFGSTTSSATQLPTTGSLFASTTTQAPTSGGLFGSTTGSNPLFGNKSPASIFGAQAVPASSTTTATSTITPPSLFGQSTQTPQPTTSLFGPGLPQPSGSLFGSTTQPPTTGSLFGSTLNPPAPGSLLSSRLSPSTTTLQNDPQSQFAALTQRIDGIAEAWNPNSPQCRFQHYFYNLVDPSQVNQYGRPANATNEALWQRAVRENPDPSCLVPVLAVGFDALHLRVEAQSQQAAAQQEKLKEVKKRLESLTATHNDNNIPRIQRTVLQHTQIAHRLLKMIQHLHLLIPAIRSSSIRPEEEALRGALEDMEEDIRRPGGMSKMRAKLNELWALVGAINAARERGMKAGVDGATGWTVVDEEGLQQITQILSDQQAGLQHLTKILQRDLQDLRVIMGKNTEEDMSTEMLYSSTSTLHASALR